MPRERFSFGGSTSFGDVQRTLGSFGRQGGYGGFWSNYAVGREKSNLYNRAHALLRELQEATPEKSGETKAAWEVNSPGQYTLFEVRNDLPKIHWLEFGVPTHDIYPTRASHLRFFWEKVGKWVSLDMVEHPGMRPLGFVRSVARGFLNAEPKSIRQAISVVIFDDIRIV